MQTKEAKAQFDVDFWLDRLRSQGVICFSNDDEVWVPEHTLTMCGKTLATAEQTLANNVEAEALYRRFAEWLFNAYQRDF